MSRICELTNRKKSVGNMVSHSNRKTRRSFRLNLCRVTLFSNILNIRFRFRLASKTLRTIDFKGDLDTFLLSTRTAKLSKKGQKIKRKLKKFLARTRQEKELAVPNT